MVAAMNEPMLVNLHRENAKAFCKEWCGCTLEPGCASCAALTRLLGNCAAAAVGSYISGMQTLGSQMASGKPPWPERGPL